VAIVSSSSPATSQKVTLTIGTVSTTWTVTTKSVLTILATETFPIAIADGTGTSSAIYGTASGVHFDVPSYPGVVLDKVTLSLKITHPLRNELKILLFSPLGQPTTIYFAVPGQSSGSNMDATFDDAATNTFVASCSAATTLNSCTGLVQPYAPFSNLGILNKDPTGMWAVFIQDGYQNSTGSIQASSLNLTYKPAP
jgi:subtilisin-like proprotein convertase family protein